MGALSRLMALDLAFCRRADLRELAIQMAHLKARCGFAFKSRLGKDTGLSGDQLAALAVWESSSQFDEEQRLVLAYAEAVADNAVSDELFAPFAATSEKRARSNALRLSAIGPAGR